jgi:hypothetical protein
MIKSGCMAAYMCAMAALVLAGGCGKEEHGHDQNHDHAAAHGGCLNVIGSCENGHAEVKVEGDVLRLWFVSGEKNTDKAVRVPDNDIALSVKVEGEKDTKTLMLKCKPSQLLEEKDGDCSCFEGQADWLKTAKDFEATGAVTFKGKRQEFKIDYPHGHDPDHEGHGDKHEH